MAFAEASEPSSRVATVEQERQPFSTNTIVYEAYPSVIAPESGQDGKKTYLQALKEYIQSGYYNDLHVGAIWLNPIYEDEEGGYDTFYDVADHTKIAKKFGSLQEFREMMDAAREKGIHIVMDLVANHCSSLDQDYQEAISTPDNAKQEMFLFYDPDLHESKPPIQELNAFGKPVWQPVEWKNGEGEVVKRKWVYTSFHDIGQRDYNWASPLVQEKFRNIIEFWMQKGVAGFRGDALPFIKDYSLDQPIPPDVTMMNGAGGEHARKHIKQIAQWIGPGGILVPEGSMDDTLTELRDQNGMERFIDPIQVTRALERMQYYTLEDEATTCRIAPVYFFPYYLDWHDARSIKLFHDAFYKWHATHPEELHAFGISDHDTSARGFSRLGSYLTARQAKIESYRAPMTIMYAGDELGQKNAEIANPTDIVGRDRARQALEVEQIGRQQKDPYSEWSFTQQLGWIKLNIPAFTQGKYEPLNLGEHVYGYILHHGSGDLLVLHTIYQKKEGVSILLEDLVGKNAQVLLSSYMSKEQSVVRKRDGEIHLRPTESVIIQL